jgi:hypothetical protein
MCPPVPFIHRPAFSRSGLLAFTCPLLVAIAAPGAGAVVPRLYVEPAVGLWLDDDHSDVFASGMYLAIRPALSFGSLLELQLSYAVFYTPATWDHSTDNTAHTLYGGIRMRPLADTRAGHDLGGLFIDANAGYVRMAGNDTFGFDVGLGFDFVLTPMLSLGAVMRYGHIFGPDDSNTPGTIQSDGQFLTIGMDFGFGPNQGLD